jgi:hypothetical protein
MCPKADDPFTIDQNYRSFKLIVHGSTHLVGTLELLFIGKTSYLSLSQPSNANCVKALTQSRAFGHVGCSFDLISPYHYEFNITVYSWPVFPSENNLFYHDGNPSLSMFSCQVNSSYSCLLEDLTTKNIQGMSPPFHVVIVTLIGRICLLFQSWPL